MNSGRREAGPLVRLDHARASRTGEPEVVYGEGKDPGTVAAILDELVAGGSRPVLATRCSPAHAAAYPAGTYDEDGRVLVALAAPPQPELGTAVVACAGTSDVPVAREAVAVLEAFGVTVDLVADVGVAGVHRILAETDRLAGASVCIVVAGMEAALPTVVAGLVSCPVVGVPTSVGYGASFDGLAALLGMLNSCAPGISVVNIDSGFAAAMVARRILLAGRR
jgi:NCAIR mutase (PurE)-related protein